PSFKSIRDAYVIEFLRLNPSVNTYLGGAGLHPSLVAVDGRLRDVSPAGLAAEDRWLMETQKQLEGLDPHEAMTVNNRIDREVMVAQIRYKLRLHQVRRYQERSLDPYPDEPFRAIDFQLQGLTQTGANSYGTPEEWSLVIARLNAVPAFLKNAETQ